jgi:hypothetical protein
LETVLDFAFVPEFLAATSLLEPAEVCRTELKPFLTIFGTSMRAIECSIRRTLHGIAIGNADASSNAFAENWKN